MSAEKGSVMGEYREEVRRLRALNADLLTAAQHALAAMEQVWEAKNRDDDFIYDEMGSVLSAAFFALREAAGKARNGVP